MVSFSPTISYAAEPVRRSRERARQTHARWKSSSRERCPLNKVSLRASIGAHPYIIIKRDFRPPKGESRSRRSDSDEGMWDCR